MLEFIICSICPIPGTGNIYWSFIEAPRFRSRNSISMGSMGYVLKPVPVDVLLSLLMIGRIYLFCRFIVLHSKQFQDASTRTLAALNRIQVNFTFVMKTVLDQRPMLFLSIFLLAFWVTSAWSFVQCERPGRDEESQVLYANAMWFIAATFNGNGYGDIVPKTIAGRVIGIFVGIIGAIISSILIAVVSRNILLSQGQRNVNNFMNDSRMSQEHKNSAARVIQTMWKTYRCLHSNQVADRLLRKCQRQFLNAIYE
jgi:potassium intermediate/small conductance calcium-activated channel subfamily N protein 3/potassium intermediate/small conductance calcium-activated channel subfamily N